MPEINSYVIYGSNGVCKVTDKRTERQCGTKKEYFVLEPVDNSGAAIYIPVDNTELIAKMKSVLCKEQVIELIMSLKGECTKWKNDRKERSEQFSATLNSGSRRDLMLMMHCIFAKKTELSQNGKRLSAADESVLKRAEKLIYEEFALALGITGEEVPAYIAAAIEA